VGFKKKKWLYTIPAHSKLISNVRFQADEGHFLLTSSYDGTARLWSSTNYQLIKTLSGPGGRMMRAEMSPDSEMIATTSFDRTWKLWMYEPPDATFHPKLLNPELEDEDHGYMSED